MALVRDLNPAVPVRWQPGPTRFILPPVPTQTDRLSAALADRYRIERELGAGGMATVYLAHDVRHDRSVAIKVLKPELAESLGRQRFVREIQMAARLNHPHILSVHDSGECDGFLYFVMPVMQGQTLRDRLDAERTLPVDEALRIASEVAGFDGIVATAARRVTEFSA